MIVYGRGLEAIIQPQNSEASIDDKKNSIPNHRH
jgi:hypothetical protein